MPPLWFMGVGVTWLITPWLITPLVQELQGMKQLRTLVLLAVAWFATCCVVLAMRALWHFLCWVACTVVKILAVIFCGAVLIECPYLVMGIPLLVLAAAVLLPGGRAGGSDRRTASPYPTSPPRQLARREMFQQQLEEVEAQVLAVKESFRRYHGGQECRHRKRKQWERPLLTSSQRSEAELLKVTEEELFEGGGRHGASGAGGAAIDDVAPSQVRVPPARIGWRFACA